MGEYISFFLLVLTSFLAIINPLGLAPVYLSLTDDLDEKSKRKAALKSSITAFITLGIFAFAGQLLFKFFGISVNGFRIAGGVIFFIMGYDMLNARLSSIKYSDKKLSEAIEDISITPLGIPMIAGPGAITSAIVLMEDAKDTYYKIVLTLGIITVILIAYLSMIGATKINKFLGKTGNKILLKLMGLIVMVIAVEYFFAGLKPIVQDMLGIVAK